MNGYTDRAAILIAAAVIVGTAGTANAADMMRRVPPATPLSQAEVAYIQPTRVHDWTGFYAGGFVEYGWGADIVGIAPPVTVGEVKPKGFGGGVDVGYNYQTGSFVVGIEADLAMSSMKDDISRAVFGGSVANVKYDWFATIRPRAGVAFDNFLIYATGGLAVGGIDYRVAAPAGSFHDKSTRAGFALGAGVEYAFSKQLSLKAEYLYTNLETRTRDFGPGYSTTSIGVANHVRVGVNYHF